MSAVGECPHCRGAQARITELEARVAELEGKSALRSRQCRRANPERVRQTQAAKYAKLKARVGPSPPGAPR